MRLPLAGAILCLAAGAADADTGRDLITVCSQSASLCNSDFQSDEVLAALQDNPCRPAEAGTAEAAIVAWLDKHPKTAGRDIAKAVKTAAAALWPCNGRTPGQ